MEENKNVFETLRAINLESKHKQKGKLTYLPWATAWATVKLAFPDANYETIKDENGNRYHVEGKTCYVETQVTIQGETISETLAIMDNAIVGSVLRTEIAPTVSVMSMMTVARIGTPLIVTMLCPSDFV